MIPEVEASSPLYHQTLTLTATPPFDFAKSLAFLQSFRPAQGEQRLTEDSLTRALRSNGTTVIFRLWATGIIEVPTLVCELWSEAPLDGVALDAVVNRIRFYLSLDDDLNEFYALGRHDPTFAPLIDQLYGYHQVKFLTPFENACWAVLTSRNHWAAALAAKGRLAEQYGGALAHEGTLYRAFPEATDLLGAEAGDLALLVRQTYRARYLRAVTLAFAGVDEGWLRNAPPAEVLRWLRHIHGIGPWSASFVLLRGLGRVEQLPMIDPVLMDAVVARYRCPPVAEVVQEIAHHYGPYQGYWAHYLRAAG
jgi:DNA-3-methyladenine glycosylase II